jgi:small GTP-binding protein
MPLFKKVCMIGSFAVGKTSLVRRCVHGIFSEEYKTTVGAKVDNRVVRVGEKEMTLALWDLYGEDKFQTLLRSHLSGTFGYLLVADGTRLATLHEAEALEAKMRQEIGSKPFIFLLNKSDLRAEWEIDDSQQADLTARGWEILHTSAKTGEGVEAAFQRLAEKMLG